MTSINKTVCSLFVAVLPALLALSNAAAGEGGGGKTEFKLNNVAVTFPADYKTAENAAKKTITAESPDGSAKFTFIGADILDFDEIIKSVFEPFLRTSFDDVRNLGEEHFEANKLGLRKLIYDAKSKAGGAVQIVAQFAFKAGDEKAKSTLLISVCKRDFVEKNNAVIDEVFKKECLAGAQPALSK